MFKRSYIDLDALNSPGTSPTPFSIPGSATDIAEKIFNDPQSWSNDFHHGMESNVDSWKTLDFGTFPVDSVAVTGSNYIPSLSLASERISLKPFSDKYRLKPAPVPPSILSPSGSVAWNTKWEGVRTEVFHRPISLESVFELQGELRKGILRQAPKKFEDSNTPDSLPSNSKSSGTMNISSSDTSSIPPLRISVAAEKVKPSAAPSPASIMCSYLEHYGIHLDSPNHDTNMDQTLHTVRLEESIKDRLSQQSPKSTMEGDHQTVDVSPNCPTKRGAEKKNGKIMQSSDPLPDLSQIPHMRSRSFVSNDSQRSRKKKTLPDEKPALPTISLMGRKREASTKLLKKANRVIQGQQLLHYGTGQNPSSMKLGPRTSSDTIVDTLARRAPWFKAANMLLESSSNSKKPAFTRSLSVGRSPGPVGPRMRDRTAKLGDSGKVPSSVELPQTQWRRYNFKHRPPGLVENIEVVRKTEKSDSHF